MTSALHNAARGEALLSVDGELKRLCLTLGALAELEAAFDCPSLQALGERLLHLSPSDLLIVIAALLAGGGAPTTPAALAAARIDPREAAAAVALAFHRSLDDA